MNPDPSSSPTNSLQTLLNRELSLLDFQARVLEESQDEKNPLLERVKFLSIFGSNMDEFFMVRVSGSGSRSMRPLTRFPRMG